MSDKKLYPTFARTSPPGKQVAKFITSLLLYHDWRRVTLIVGEEQTPSAWQRIDSKLREFMTQYHITLNQRKAYKEPYFEVWAGNGSAWHNVMERIVEQTYKTTRGRRLKLSTVKC